MIENEIFQIFLRIEHFSEKVPLFSHSVLVDLQRKQVEFGVSNSLGNVLSAVPRKGDMVEPKVLDPGVGQEQLANDQTTIGAKGVVADIEQLESFVREALDDQLTGNPDVLFSGGEDVGQQQFIHRLDLGQVLV